MMKKEIVIQTVNGPQMTIGWIGKGLAVVPYYVNGTFDRARFSIAHTLTGYGIFLGLRPRNAKKFIKAVRLADEEWGDFWANEEIYGASLYESWRLINLINKLAWMVAPTLFPEKKLDWILQCSWMCFEIVDLIEDKLKQTDWWMKLSKDEKVIIYGWLAEQLGFEHLLDHLYIASILGLRR